MDTLIPTTFEFHGELAPKARRVSIVSSFNGWDAAAHPLTKTPGGNWVITVYVPAGRIVYGFEVDGVFRPDPFGEGRMPNGRGSEYSIRNVRYSEEASPGRIAADEHTTGAKRRRPGRRQHGRPPRASSTNR